MRVACLAVVCLGLMSAPTPAAAQNSKLDELVERAGEFPDRVDRLRSQYLKPAQLESKFTIETRFNDARVAYTLEDYERASLLFADVVRSDGFDQFEGAREALYLLGESLYEQRNFLSAKKYYRRVVDRGQGEHYQDSIVRLLEIAAKTGNYADTSKLFQRFDGDRSMGPAVQYMRGKTLFREGEPGKAIPFFRRASESEDWEHRARYFIGVALAKQRKYADAREEFRALTREIETEGSREREMVHLSYLALGRIAYEQRNIEEAVNFYQKLPRSSEHFDRALYELTWVLVSRGNYEAASRNADIFLYLSDPDPTFIPEVKLLKADLLLRRENYDEASVAYRDVIDQFKPVRERMESFLQEEERDVDKFFRQLVEQEFQGDNPVYMPRQVQRWIDRGEKLAETRQLVRDVGQLQRDLERSRRAIEQMKARIGSGSTIDSFPELAEGMRIGIETDHQLVQLQRNLLEHEYRILRSEMNDSEKRRWRELEEEFDAFEERYKAVPKTRGEVKERERTIRRKFSKLREELDSVEYMLEGQRDQLESVDEYIRENQGGIEKLPEEKRQRAEALRKEVRRNIADLEAQKKELTERVELVEQRVGIGDQVTEKERQMREKYRSMVEERRRFLEQFHDRADADERAQLEKIQRARESLDPAHRRLKSFFTEMQQIVREKAEELEKKIRREEKMLTERERQLEEMMRRSKDEATKAAINNYLRVREKFDNIVMRGDVGLLDVAWQQKQDRTEELNQLRQNRRRELKQLQQSFEEVR